jgi:predicted aminopeptidase
MPGKNILRGLLAILVFLLIWQWELISYGLMQGYGQAKILWNAEPVEKVLADPTFPDSLKQKLRLIAEIKRYAVDSLGINPSDNYTTFFNQQGKPLLWIVTACERYELKAKEWEFPVVGKVSYKGFFDKEKLKKAQKELDEQGYDTEIDEVAGWSTLGWFKDPILSSMLRRSEGSLANLIIHELTHGTLFVKGNLDYNENLAEFVGDQGALRFLAQKYGKNSRQYLDYEESKQDYKLYTEHLLTGTRRLDSLYQSLKKDERLKYRGLMKKDLIREIMAGLETLPFHHPKWKRLAREDTLPNNAFFVGYITYRSQQNLFEEEFRQDFSSNFPAYLAYLKGKYGKN